MIRQTGNRNLRKLNTFGTDAVARLFVEYSAPSDLAALNWAALPQPVRSIGEGSNMLFTGDFQGTLLHSGVKGIEVDRERSAGDDVFVTVGTCARSGHQRRHRSRRQPDDKDKGDPLYQRAG